jgi:hypothetical protein
MESVEINEGNDGNSENYASSLESRVLERVGTVRDGKRQFFRGLSLPQSCFRKRSKESHASIYDISGSLALEGF